MIKAEKFRYPKFSPNKLKYKVNERFFDKWNPQTAYILGFTYADGTIYKTSLGWDIQTRDKDLLLKINETLGSTYPITKRVHSVRLRISNQKLINGAKSKGLLPKKKMRKILPKMPKIYLKHFIRGYLDGDGWIVIRKNKQEGDIGFVSGNKSFLKYLNSEINNVLHISKKVREKTKITAKKVVSTTYHLEFYSSNAFKIATWLYKDIKKEDLFLIRKYNKYLEMKELYEFPSSGTKVVRVVQKRFGRSIKDLLEDLYLKQRLEGVQIAEILNVHSSSIYRWLARIGIKYPISRKKSLYG